MTAIGTGRLSPKQRFNIGQISATPFLEDEAPQLKLRNIIGTTTTSINAFDVLPQYHIFACCAGPAVTLFQVDEQLRTHQRIYRARSGISPIHTTTSFYNPVTSPPSTPSRSRHISPLKNGSARASILPETLPDSPSNCRTRTRSREATCLSLSRDGTLIAIGEHALAPQVTIWSTAKDARPDIPLSILTDHSAGVQSVAFSADSRWLCSLGDAFDGFILLYSVSPKTGAARLHASNKCSNAKTVAWMGNRLITAGTRHVKVWKFGGQTSASPAKGRRDLENAVPGSPALFSGRNCLLGPLLLDAIFTCAMPISDRMVALCTASGDVCLLDDSDKLQRIYQLQFDIRCAYFDANTDLLWLGGQGDNIVALTIQSKEDITMPVSVAVSYVPAPSKDTQFFRPPNTVAIGSLRGSMITVDSNRIVSMRKLETRDKGYQLAHDAHRMPAHESGVLGVCVVAHAGSPGFLTYSAQGKVLFWVLDGTFCGTVDIILSQPAYIEGGNSNELKKLVAPSTDELLYAGDKIGILQILDRSGTKVAEVQAHSGEVNGIAIATMENNVFIATCGRDRNVQLFSKDDHGLNHLQTIDDHAATVTDVRFMAEASVMLSISSDRSVIIRRAANDQTALAFLMVRAVMLKASPVSFNTVPADPNAIVVSTMDRQVYKVDIATGRILPFKRANGDSAIMNSLEVHEMNQSTRILFGVSSTDKSIRVYDYNNGTLLAKEYGQAAMSAITMIQRPGTDKMTQSLSLITCGYDGTIGVWDLELHQQRTLEEAEGRNGIESPAKLTAFPAKPVRKILSKTEILDMQRSLESEKGFTTPIRRSPSPSHIRRRTSAFSFASSGRAGSKGLGSENHVSATVSGRRVSRAAISTQQNGFAAEPLHRKPLQAYPCSPLTNKIPRLNRPLLDHRRRSKSATNLNQLSDMATNLSESLHAFRKRIMPSMVDKIGIETLSALEHELASTARAVNEMTHRDASTPLMENLLDDYLAKMIDKRLALKAETIDAAEEVVEDS